MAEYIEREALLTEIDKERKRLVELEMCGAEHIVVHHARRFIEDAPAADVVEVVHGEWVKDEGKDMKRCSCCGYRVYFTHNYCPNCGAKMDG